MEQNINQQLIAIQQELKAPKSQYNSFGKYKYRSCEDILESAKPILAKNGCSLTLTDDVIFVGERYYIKATATLSNGKDNVTVSALAREAEDKKGMDESQITGTASSYARKYALNGLFCIDDTKDADATNTLGKDAIPAPKPLTKEEQQREDSLSDALDEIRDSHTKDDLKGVFYKYDFLQNEKRFIDALSARKKEIIRAH